MTPDPDICPDCKQPIDDHDLRAFDGCEIAPLDDDAKLECRTCDSDGCVCGFWEAQHWYCRACDATLTPGSDGVWSCPSCRRTWSLGGAA